MDIKPTGTGIPPLSGSNEPLNRASVTPPATRDAAPLEAGPFAAVAANFQSSDLQDPAKVENMLSQCAGELVGSALNGANGKLPQADTQYLTNWLQNDPVTRAKLLSCLQRVLR